MRRYRHCSGREVVAERIEAKNERPSILGEVRADPNVWGWDFGGQISYDDSYWRYSPGDWIVLPNEPGNPDPRLEVWRNESFEREFAPIPAVPADPHTEAVPNCDSPATLAYEYWLRYGGDLTRVNAWFATAFNIATADKSTSGVRAIPVDVKLSSELTEYTSELGGRAMVPAGDGVANPNAWVDAALATFGPYAATEDLLAFVMIFMQLVREETDRYRASEFHRVLEDERNKSDETGQRVLESTVELIADTLRVEYTDAAHLVSHVLRRQAGEGPSSEDVDRAVDKASEAYRRNFDMAAYGLRMAETHASSLSGWQAGRWIVGFARAQRDIAARLSTPAGTLAKGLEDLSAKRYAGTDDDPVDADQIACRAARDLHGVLGAMVTPELCEKWCRNIVDAANAAPRPGELADDVLIYRHTVCHGSLPETFEASLESGIMTLRGDIARKAALEASAHRVRISISRR